jgi:polyisoprenoid-binding protein YceI
MKKTFLFCAGLLMAAVAPAQYKVMDEGSKVKFTIDNFGFGVDGSFKGLQGSIDFDPQNPGEAHFDVSIDASTINTDNEMRDGHLRKEGYFDVKNYPRIRLLSTKIVAAGGGGAYLFTGQLTIRNSTREVKFPFTVTTVNGSLEFKGSFTIKRKDFGVGGTSTISNELTVSLDVQAVKS